MWIPDTLVTSDSSSAQIALLLLYIFHSLFSVVLLHVQAVCLNKWLDVNLINCQPPHRKFTECSP